MSISRMRQTKTGGLLIEINGSVDSAKRVKVEVELSLGPTVKVRLADNTVPVEVRDLDELTPREEIPEALLDQDRQNGAKVVSIRKTYGDAQTAIVMLPTEPAKRLCTAGRLRVGVVYARVRPTELRTQCYKCLTFGHLSHKCAGPDRSRCCWRCERTGHFSRECAAPSNEATAFREVLSAPVWRDNGTVLEQGPVKEDKTALLAPTMNVTDPSGSSEYVIC